MAANRPARESYRNDGRMPFSPQSSMRSVQRMRSDRSVTFSDMSDNPHPHHDIPNEDITEYTEEERALFEKFTKGKSAFLEFGGVYEEDEAAEGENFNIPQGDVTAYTEEERAVFDGFSKKASAYLNFEGVYDEEDVPFEDNYSLPARAGSAYTDDVIVELDLFQKAKSMRLQQIDFNYDSDEEQAAQDSVYTESERQQLKSLRHVPSQLAAFAEEDSEEYIVVDRILGAPTLGSAKADPAAAAAVAAEADLEASDSGASALKGGAEGVPPPAPVVMKLGDSEVNEQDSTLSPPPPLTAAEAAAVAIGSKQVSLRLTPIVEGSASEEQSPVLTPQPE